MDLFCTAGYAMGLQDYAQDPQKMDEALMRTMSSRMADNDDDESESPFLSPESPGKCSKL